MPDYSKLNTFLKIIHQFHMKIKFLLFTVISCLIAKTTSFAQTNYSLTFGNNQNYYTTCGENNSSQWTVNFQHKDCYLYTPVLTPIGSGMTDINYSFRINQAGNNTEYDTLHLELYTTLQGWNVIHTVLGNDNNAVNYDIQGMISVDASTYVIFRLHAIVSINNSFWAIKKDNTTFTVENVTPTYEFLPVSLISFSGFSINNHTNLSWTTLSETNNYYFTIERSDDNINFYSIGEIPGSGNSNSPVEYQFTDTTRMKSDITYYLLKQTNFNGTTETIHSTAVMKKSQYDKKLWWYFENSFIYINFETNIDETIHLKVFNPKGRICIHEKIFANKGINTFLYPIEKLCPGKGLFFFSITDASSKVHSIKVVL